MFNRYSLHNYHNVWQNGKNLIQVSKSLVVGIFGTQDSTEVPLGCHRCRVSVGHWLRMACGFVIIAIMSGGLPRPTTLPSALQTLQESVAPHMPRVQCLLGWASSLLTPLPSCTLTVHMLNHWICSTGNQWPIIIIMTRWKTGWTMVNNDYKNDEWLSTLDSWLLTLEYICL